MLGRERPRVRVPLNRAETQRAGSQQREVTKVSAEKAAQSPP